MPTDPQENEDTYLAGSEKAMEMSHLLLRDRYITQCMGGIFSECGEFPPSDFHRMLDIGCGTGGWVIDVAYAYPESEVIGIDVSHIMVEYARSQALIHGLENASFRTMDVLKSLDFPEGYFDLVN